MEVATYKGLISLVSAYAQRKAEESASNQLHVALSAGLL
jgi:hypothetical protein